MSEKQTDATVLDVVCLCAGWCNNCTSYRPVFDAVQAQFDANAMGATGQATRFSWVDIEDESEVIGDVEVENFPTLLLIQDGMPLFFGPLTPQPGVLGNLVQTALDGRLAALPGGTEQELAQRVRAYLG